MSNEMIERVAEALFDVMSTPQLRSMFYGNADITYAEVVHGVERGFFVASVLDPERNLARAAIEAMREPTDEMLKAIDANARAEERAACLEEVVKVPARGRNLHSRFKEGWNCAMRDIEERIKAQGEAS